MRQVQLDLYKKYLQTNKNLNPKKIIEYSDFNRIDKFLQELFPAKNDISVLDFNNPAEFRKTVKKLQNLSSYVRANEESGNRLFYTLINYKRFLEIKKVFPKHKDFIGNKETSIELEKKGKENNADMATQREKFLNYLQTCVKTTRATDNNPLFLGGNAPKDYVRFLDSDRLFDYNPSKWKHISSMYEINDYKTALDVFNKLVADKAFVARDKEDNQGWRRGAISHYVCFLRAQEFFTANTNFASTKTTEEEKLPVIKRSGGQKFQQMLFSIQQVISDIDSTGLLYDDVLIKRFAFSLMSKQFLILSGLAGSGKTQLAIAFASALIEDDSQMCIVPVGADWTNREPLLGFPNALKEGEYVKPDNGVLDLLINASMPENASKPFFLILDEMNMSYVERYFADFLSAMESHKAIPLWNGEDENEAPRSISLPKNLFIIGTINVDETTYMFSPKVLDRANVIEFKISDEEMDSFLNNMNPIDRDSILYKDAGMGASFVELAGKDELAGDGAIKETLSTFFRNLKSVNAEFGYRSATEIYRFVWQAQNNDDCADDEKMKIDEILDCAIVQKLLPKLHGSRKKLEPVLQALWKECFDKENKDLVMSRDNVQKAKYPLTADKIQRMHDAAQINGFTSFAEA